MGKRKSESGISKKNKKERRRKLTQTIAGPLNKNPTQIQDNDFNSPFCTQLTNEVLIRKIEEGSNIVLSPLSIQLMLSLIAVGSKGRTLEQILSHLGSKSIDHLNELSSQIVNFTLRSTHDSNDPLLAFANGIWVDRVFSLKSSFEKVAKEAYKAKTKEVDFATKARRVREKVNLWVKKETKGLVTEILPSDSLDSETSLVLANALYFKGEWNLKFDKRLTINRKFHLIDGQTIEVPFMTGSRNPECMYKSSDGYKILCLPYEKGQDTRNFSMYFFLPDKIDGLQDLVQKINSVPNFLNQKFQLRHEELSVLWIPKFRFSFEFQASETIKEMGIELPFNRGVGELTEMVNSTKNEDLYLSEIFHKSFIEVNEDGTEASAISAYYFINCCRRLNPPRFVADHPFMFMIREETSGVVLFTGAVMNPL